nr:MAG TPA: hypothetical protein [Crassvirales sp.]
MISNLFYDDCCVHSSEIFKHLALTTANMSASSFHLSPL